MSATASGRAAPATRHPIQLAALVVGVVFLAVGILGFVPGITSDFDTIGLAGHESEAKLLGLFQVSILHNIVHALFGVGVLMSRTFRNARTYLIGGGVLYLVLWLYGLFVADDQTSANFVPFNNADNWLHLGLGIGMIGIGVALSRRVDSTTRV